MIQALKLNTSAPKSTISARPLLSTYPTGCCMNAFAIRSTRPKGTTERHQPNDRGMQLLESLSQPKIHKPRKVDSRKNASRLRSPMALRRYHQHNWRSSPVHPKLEFHDNAGDHPIAKFIRKSFPKISLISCKFHSRCVHTSFPGWQQSRPCPTSTVRKKVIDSCQSNCNRDNTT